MGGFYEEKIKIFYFIFLISSIAFYFSFFKRDINAIEGSWFKVTDELYGGYINFFTVDSIDSKILYVSTNNGVFKSEDFGKTWKNLGLTEYNINSIDIDFNDSKIIYVSTEGDGILKSIDEGLSWKKINDGIEDLNVKFVRIDKNNNSIIYSITWSGIFKSIDGGESWFQINNGLTDLKVKALEIDSNDPNILYCGTDSGL